MKFFEEKDWRSGKNLSFTIKNHQTLMYHYYEINTTTKILITDSSFYQRVEKDERSMVLS